MYGSIDYCITIFTIENLLLVISLISGKTDSYLLHALNIDYGK